MVLYMSLWRDMDHLYVSSNLPIYVVMLINSMEP
jgi:hypothetical protein